MLWAYIKSAEVHKCGKLDLQVCKLADVNSLIKVLVEHGIHMCLSSSLSSKLSATPSMRLLLLLPKLLQYIAVPRLSVDRILRLGTGWEPPIRGSKMFERLPRPHLTKKFHFFCKKDMAHPIPGRKIFFGVQKKILSPPNWQFFVGSVTFPKLRDHFQNFHLLIIFSSNEVYI